MIRLSVLLAALSLSGCGELGTLGLAVKCKAVMPAVIDTAPNPGDRPDPAQPPLF